MKAAVIDIGTNSCRLLIGARENKQTENIKILKRKVKITRLGEGVDQNKRLKRAAVERVYEVLKSYKKIIDNFQIEKIRIIGTSALRDVSNAFLLKSKLNLLAFKLEVISGKKEAELNYLGAVSNLKSKFLLIDIGGGSTEFIWPEAEKINFKSLDIGCVRMTERFISNPEAEAKAAEISNLEIYLEKRLKNKLNLTQNYKLKGVGGTITTLAAVKLALENYDSQKIENLKINYQELLKIINELAELNLKARKRIKGLQPKRADVILTGLIILKSILKYIESPEIVVSDHDLLYGLLKKELIAE